jgi:hypothetical protein
VDSRVKAEHPIWKGIERTRMADLAIQIRDVHATVICAFCNKQGLMRPGPALVTVDGARPVCNTCGRNHAPALEFLMQVANRVPAIDRAQVDIAEALVRDTDEGEMTAVQLIISVPPTKLP